MAELYRVLKNGGLALIRGASFALGHNRFNPVSEEAISKYFSDSKFKSGFVLPILCFQWKDNGWQDCDIAKITAFLIMQ